MIEKYFLLYKTPYKHFTDKGIWRYLLEQEDIYIYLWIKNSNLLDSFQVVYADKSVVTFKNNVCKIGIISHEPINRAIVDNNFVNDKKEISDFIANIYSKDLPVTVECIKYIINADVVVKKTLIIPKKEALFLSKLTKNAKK